MDDSYVSKCPECQGWVIIKPAGTFCCSCEWFSPARSNAENMTECRKPGEPRFVPPKQIPHPNGRKC
jgi:hypothetical protein